MSRLSPIHAVVSGVKVYAMSPLFRWAAPPHRFVVLTTPRTGSELLVELLDSHPDVRCEGEILYRPPRVPVRYVRSRAVRERAGAQAYGFKLMAHHVAWQPHAYSSLEDFIAELQEAGFGLVVLRRERLLDQALSFLAAPQIGYHPRHRDGVAVDRLPVDPADLIHVLVLLEQQVAALDLAIGQLEHIALTYETDLRDPAAQQPTIDRLCGWLGLTQAAVSSDLVRAAPEGLAAKVVNPAAVAGALRATRFAALAEELG